MLLFVSTVLEADFRKMTSPNRVECPNCGGKFKVSDNREVFVSIRLNSTSHTFVMTLLHILD